MPDADAGGWIAVLPLAVAERVGPVAGRGGKLDDLLTGKVKDGAGAGAGSASARASGVASVFAAGSGLLIAKAGVAVGTVGALGRGVAAGAAGLAVAATAGFAGSAGVVVTEPAFGAVGAPGAAGLLVSVPFRSNPRATRKVLFACSTLIGFVRTRFAPIRNAFATPA